MKTKARLLTDVLKICFVALTLNTLSACVTTIESSQIKADPDKALENHIQLALGYLQNDNRDLARFHLNKALEYDKNSPGANNGMAVLYQLEGEKQLAEKYFKTALRADRKFSQARFNYGNFLYQQKRYDEAYEQFEMAAEDLNYERRDLALYSVGRAALQLDNVERAEAALQHSLKLNPKLNLAMVELAEISFNKEDYVSAKKYIDQYATISRHSPRTLWLGIRIERIFGNKDKEASYALQLKNLHPYSKEYLEYKESLEQE